MKHVNAESLEHELDQGWFWGNVDTISERTKQELLEAINFNKIVHELAKEGAFIYVESWGFPQELAVNKEGVVVIRTYLDQDWSSYTDACLAELLKETVLDLHPVTNSRPDIYDDAAEREEENACRVKILENLRTVLDNAVNSVDTQLRQFELL